MKYVISITALAVVVFAASASAGKPAKPVIVATPSGSQVVFSGSGFKADTQYFVRVFDSAGNQVFNLGSATDASGNLDPVAFSPSASGPYSVSAFELKPSGVLAQKASASASFTVV